MRNPRRRRAAFALTAAALLTSAALAAEEPPPRVITSDPAALAASKAKYAAKDPDTVAAVKAVTAAADKALTQGPWTVTTKSKPIPGYDPHDYVSLAPYFWPDPSKPDGLPYKEKDGERNPELNAYDRNKLGAMTDRTYELALAYYFTGDQKYAEHAAKCLRTWYLDPATRMNPNFEHAQMVRGRNEGRSTGIIDGVGLMKPCDAAGLLAGSGAWTDEDQKGLVAWYRDFLDWMRTSKNGKAEGAAKNNHGNWYDTQTITYALFVGDEDWVKQRLDTTKARITKQIEPDGKQPEETRRTLGIHYCIYNLEAVTQTAAMGTRVGVDLWAWKTDDGRSIRKAIDWIVPYATGQEKWPYQQIHPDEVYQGFVPVLRRAEAAYGEPAYEDAIAKLRGVDVKGIDQLAYPPTAAKK